MKVFKVADSSKRLSTDCMNPIIVYRIASLVFRTNPAVGVWQDMLGVKFHKLNVKGEGNGEGNVIGG